MAAGKKWGAGKGHSFKKLAISVPLRMLDVGVGECQRGRQRKVSCGGASFILRSPLDNAETEVFCS